MASSGVRVRTGARVGSGDVAILVSAAAYGVSTVVSVVALHAVRPADLLAVELVGAATLLLCVAAVTGRLRRRGMVRQLLLGALMPGLAFLSADVGLARTSASSASLLLAVDPLLSVLLAVAVLGERLRGRAVVALAVGLSGSVLVALGPGDDQARANAALGNLLVVAAVMAGVVFLVAARRYGDENDGLGAGAWQATGGALVTAPFVAVSWAGGGGRLVTASAPAWTACVGVVVCGAVASVAFNRGIGRVPATRAGQLANLTPVVGTLTAIVFLGERPSLLQLAGGVAILVGLTLLLRGEPLPASPTTDKVTNDEPSAMCSGVRS